MFHARGLQQSRVQRRVVQGAVFGERTVADGERDFLVAARQGQAQFLVVTEQVESGEAAPDLGAGEIHAVVVVPESGGALLVRIDVFAGVAGLQQIGRVAIAFGRGAAAVQMRHDGQRQRVAQTHGQTAAAPGFDGGTGERTVVAPDRRGEAGEQGRGGRARVDFVTVDVRFGGGGFQNGGARQRNLERLR